MTEPIPCAPGLASPGVEQNAALPALPGPGGASPYKKILVVVDGSENRNPVLEEGSRIARLSGAAVTVMHVVDPLHHINGFERPWVYIHDILPSLLRSGAKLLEDAGARLLANGCSVDTVLEEGRGECLADLIVARAKADHADLIVLGTHAKRGMERLLMGSDAEEVVRTSPVPVLLVRMRS